MRGWPITLPLGEAALPLGEAETEAGTEPELSRVTVLVGELQLDVGIPAEMTAAAVATDVIELANTALSTQRERGDAVFDATEGRWTLARLGAPPFDAQRSLAECNVCDGEVLVIREAALPCAPVLFDDLDAESEDPQDGKRRAPMSDAAMTACFVVGVLASAGAALLLGERSAGPPATAAALAVGALGVIAASVAGRGGARAAASPWLSAAAIPLLFAGALHLVPGGWAPATLPVGFAVTGCVALLGLLISGRGRAFYTAVIGLCVLGGGAAVAVLLWSPPVRTTGAILAAVSVIVVYLAPRTTILLSKLPVPPVPTAGEPLDDIEAQGGTTVEGVNAIGKQVIPTEQGMVARVGPSNGFLTGIVAAAALCCVVGSYLAVDVSNGFFWQGTAFAVAVACVLCLRGRSHYDVVQSATLIGAGLVSGLAVTAKTAACLDGWHVNAALGLVAVVMIVVACGLIAPQLEFSPVVKRYVELFEYMAIVLLFPLCFWIIRLYAFFRELHL